MSFRSICSVSLTFTRKIRKHRLETRWKNKGELKFMMKANVLTCFLIVFLAKKFSFDKNQQQVAENKINTRQKHYIQLFKRSEAKQSPHMGLQINTRFRYQLSTITCKEIWKTSQEENLRFWANRRKKLWMRRLWN